MFLQHCNGLEAQTPMIFSFLQVLGMQRAKSSTSTSSSPSPISSTSSSASYPSRPTAINPRSLLLSPSARSSSSAASSTPAYSASFPSPIGLTLVALWTDPCFDPSPYSLHFGHRCSHTDLAARGNERVRSCFSASSSSTITSPNLSPSIHTDCIEASGLIFSRSHLRWESASTPTRAYFL